ncbi:unnamed protein product [Leptosia nina]|uniref:Epg5-like TPR domain-containing protein n=1 Tax=Leptosia nina TaxID=320188 RepID=A0AAV1J428_9NEOP
MATLVKEKRKEKNKSKEKSTRKHERPTSADTLIAHEIADTELQSDIQNETGILSKTGSIIASENNISCSSVIENDVIKISTQTSQICNLEAKAIEKEYIDIKCPNVGKQDSNLSKEVNSSKIQNVKVNLKNNETIKAQTVVDSYRELNKKLQRMQIPSYDQESLVEIEDKVIGNEITPSAPLLELPVEVKTELTAPKSSEPIVRKLQESCMPLEEALRIYGGREIAEVREMSEREEAAVETGPLSGPEHPLVDLLSTFRSSLSVLEKERVNINCGYTEEDKRRALLWRIERRSILLSEKCPCGANVDLRVVYDYAELLKDRLPAAKLRLEGLLRDVQESYCHHQHAALMAHCQIEELISETIQSNKVEIREALTLVLHACRISDGAPAVYPKALERWATLLTEALVDERDLRQLLFVIHHLFRQSRSVQWAGRVIRMRAQDTSSAARLIAVLDILLTGSSPFDNALECTEEFDTWEEVDVKGDSGAVGEGRLRERDLLIVLNSLPLRDLVARIALFGRSDISQTSEYEWGDSSGGHGILKACCGTRVLLDVVSRGARAQKGYLRLREKLRTLATSMLQALAALHMHSSASYKLELEMKISKELEGCFAAGISMMGEELHRLPATLLSNDTAREYCMAFENLHDSNPQHVEPLRVDVPVLSCESRVKVLAQIAIDRLMDRELATVVLQFLFQKCSCDVAARDSLCRLIDVHSYLHTPAFHIFADISHGEAIDTEMVKHLHVEKWRPTPGDLQVVLNDWSQRCPQFIQQLLMSMDYTPHSGVLLESQLYIGWWLTQMPEVPDWAWTLLRVLRLHRSHWALPYDAPSVDKPPETLLEMMFAILASDWGHCIPLACEPGVEALHRLSVSRPIEAVHCLGRLMTLMAHSPESISFTPKFSEVVTVILNWGPNVVQRAFGRGGQSGSDLLLSLIINQLLDTELRLEFRSALLTAWLRALWTPSQISSSRAILDAAVRATQDWRTLDAHVTVLLQEENSKQYIDDALRHAFTAPLLCESVLRRAHGIELSSEMYNRVLDILAAQKINKQKIHVDNAIKQAGATTTSDELVIHRTATAILNVPFSHPAHLTLWRLFFHLYLQRPPASPHEFTTPVGPLFFSGLVKTRTLAQLKKRLQDTITYHHSAIESCNQTPKIDQPQTSMKRIEKSPTSDNIFPELSIVDMVDESSEESNCSDEEDKQSEIFEIATVENDNSCILAYHSGAEKLAREHSRWLEEGEKVRASPHHADIARFVPEHALSAAWHKCLQNLSPKSPTIPKIPQITEANNLTYHEMALKAIHAVKDRAHIRRKKIIVKSLVEQVNFNDARTVLRLIEQHLTEVEKFAREWSSEVQRISQLDVQLWESVRKLRVRRALPPVKKSCPQNCRPITLRIAEDEWCISTAAEREIQENRRSARASVRRLCRPRPHFARTAATLLAAAKRTSNAETAVSICERVWRYTPMAHSCTPAQQLFTNTVTLLAEKWICTDSRRSADLLSRWSHGDPSQQLLCSSLISPLKLPMRDWAQVYMATCKANLPSHAMFSYLSKFDMPRWSREVDTKQRKDVLEALTATAQKWGAKPDQEHYMLIELLGVHSHAVVTASELSEHICNSCQCASRVTLPPEYCAYLTRSVQSHAHQLSFDQIGHLLRDIGSLWWEARKAALNTEMYVHYAPHMSDLLTALQRAFVAAALALSYAAERVTLYAWSSLLESWSAWISPHSLPPLLPSACEDEQYSLMLHHFVDCIKQVMGDCPDSTESLLCEIWSWTVETYCANSTNSTQECRVQLSAMLSVLGQELSWQHQWFRPTCLPRAIQISKSTDREITSWCSATLSHTKAETWLHAVPEQHLPPTLGALFELFTSKNMQFSQQCLSECCGICWWRLPTPALDQLLEQFYFQHHNPAMPYHELPQFRVLLSACQLYVHPNTPAAVMNNASSHEKRCRSVSQYIRAIVSPPLQSHLRAQVKRLLQIIGELAPHIAQCEGQIEEILSRAVIILCMEPAANVVLPLFVQWVASCSDSLRVASMTAVATLTDFEYFLPLAEKIVRTHINKDSTGWKELQLRWSTSAWCEASACIKRGGLHAAYALLRARCNEHTPARLKDALTALHHTEINFSENEEIVALWICVAFRLASTLGEEDDMRECRNVAKELLDKWAIENKRSLLQVVALQATVPAPTPRHRLLCRLAQCSTSSSESNIRSYEAAVTAVLGSTPGDVITWHKTPTLKRLVQLANKLYPNKELYFKDELDIADNVK